MSNEHTQALIVRVAEVREMFASGEGQRLREAAHLTIADVAEAAGVHRSTVLRWEQGFTRPDRDQAIRVAALYCAIAKAITK